MGTQKIKMSQDTLYKYLCDHDVKVSYIAKLMGMVPQSLYICFRHNNSYHGRPRTFSVENIKKLNKALRQLAGELRGCMMDVSTVEPHTNKAGRTYYPGMITQLKQVGKLLNLTKFVPRVLGWSKDKRDYVVTDIRSKAYGNISEDNVATINAELLAIAEVLENVEVVPDANAFEGYGSDSSSI